MTGAEANWEPAINGLMWFAAFIWYFIMAPIGICHTWSSWGFPDEAKTAKFDEIVWFFVVWIFSPVLVTLVCLFHASCPKGKNEKTTNNKTSDN